MIMPPRLRKLALTVHVICSVGWFGAVAGFLVLAVAGLAGQNPQTVPGAYLGMSLITSFVIIPLAFGSLLTGIVSSVGTGWGLFRYYWVVAKLLISVLATIVLLVHMRPIDQLAAASSVSSFTADEHDVQTLMVIASGAALVALIVLTALSVYKPRGVTSFAARSQDDQYEQRQA